MLKYNKNIRTFLPVISPHTSRSDYQSYSSQRRYHTEEDQFIEDYQLPSLTQRQQLGHLSKKNSEILDSSYQNLSHAQSNSKIRHNKFFLKEQDPDEDYHKIDIGSPESLIRENYNKGNKTGVFQNNLMDEFLNDDYYKNALSRNQLKSQRTKKKLPINQNIESINDKSQEYLLSSKITELIQNPKNKQNGEINLQKSFEEIVLEKDMNVAKKSLSRISEQTSFSFLSSRNQSLLNQSNQNVRASTKNQTSHLSFKVRPRFSDKMDKYKQSDQQRKSTVYESTLTPIEEKLLPQGSNKEKARPSLKTLLIDLDGGRRNSKIIQRKMLEQKSQFLEEICQPQENDEIKSNLINQHSESSSEQGSSSEYDVWDNQEVEDRGFQLEKLGKKFNRTEQFLLLYKIRYGMFPTQRETIDNDQVIQYAQEMTLGDRKMYLKYFGNPQKIQFQDQNDYSKPVESETDPSPKQIQGYSTLKNKIQDEDKRSLQDLNIKDQEKLTPSTIEYGYMKSSVESEDLQQRGLHKPKNQNFKNARSLENEKSSSLNLRNLKPKQPVKSQFQRPINSKYQKTYIEPSKY